MSRLKTKETNMKQFHDGTSPDYSLDFDKIYNSQKEIHTISQSYFDATVLTRVN